MASEEDKLIHIWTTNISFSWAFLSQMTIIISHPTPSYSVYTEVHLLVKLKSIYIFPVKISFSILNHFLCDLTVNTEQLVSASKNHSIANPVEFKFEPIF